MDRKIGLRRFKISWTKKRHTDRMHNFRKAVRWNLTYDKEILPEISIRQAGELFISTHIQFTVCQ
jgi:hypothetical protein